MGQYVLAAFKTIVAIALIIWMFKSKFQLEKYALALIAGGALANATDRLTYGGVMDMFSFHIDQLNFHWYVFNLADVAITFGVVFLIYHSYKNEGKDKNTGKTAL
jgi:signal peptidase II